uniref:Acetyl-coenzyme A synthetase N-terminal domain-containing protein n=1 Tax=candidate division WOR-3 bacterium TaxID=2052148 RepID=A0A7C4CBR2_UNCW3
MAEELFHPPQELVEKANITAFMKKHGLADLDALLKRAEDISWYWAEMAKELEWFKPWDKVLDESAAPFFKWFTGAKFNIVHNCLDRHMKTSVKDKVAYIYHPEPVDAKVERWTYADLYREVNKLANAMKRLGIKNMSAPPSMRCASASENSSRTASLCGKRSARASSAW